MKLVSIFEKINPTSIFDKNNTVIDKRHDIISIMPKYEVMRTITDFDILYEDQFKHKLENHLRIIKARELLNAEVPKAKKKKKRTAIDIHYLIKDLNCDNYHEMKRKLKSNKFLYFQKNKVPSYESNDKKIKDYITFVETRKLKDKEDTESEKAIDTNNNTAPAFESPKLQTVAQTTLPTSNNLASTIASQQIQVPQISYQKSHNLLTKYVNKDLLENSKKANKDHTANLFNVKLRKESNYSFNDNQRAATSSVFFTEPNFGPISYQGLGKSNIEKRKSNVSRQMKGNSSSHHSKKQLLTSTSIQNLGNNKSKMKQTMKTDNNNSLKKEKKSTDFESYIKRKEKEELVTNLLTEIGKVNFEVNADNLKKNLFNLEDFTRPEIKKIQKISNKKLTMKDATAGKYKFVQTKYDKQKLYSEYKKADKADLQFLKLSPMLANILRMEANLGKIDKEKHIFNKAINVEIEELQNKLIDI